MKKFITENNYLLDINYNMENFLMHIGHMMPECRLKETLRYRFYKMKSPFYSLHELIKYISLSKNGDLLFELDNGIQLYAMRDTISHPTYKYLDKPKLGQLQHYPLYCSFFIHLNEIYNENIYERYYSIKKGDIIVDIGAHIGMFAINAAHTVGNEGKVIAIEPEPDNFNFLIKNVEINKLKNVLVVKKGIWSRKEELKLNINAFAGSHSFLNINNEKSKVNVNVDTLDDILISCNIKKIDFIKMDIEGSEIEALKGMKETIAYGPKMAIAAYHKIKGEPSYKRIIPELKKYGYNIHCIKGIVYANP